MYRSRDISVFVTYVLHVCNQMSWPSLHRESTNSMIVVCCDCVSATEIFTVSKQSFATAVSVTAVICFTSGRVLGMLCLYIILRYKQSQCHATKNDQHVVSQPPVPVYEDIHTTSCDKQTIELSENVAYYGQNSVC